MKRYLLALCLFSGCSLFNPQPAPGPGPGPGPDVVVVVPDDGLPDTHKQRAPLTAAAKTLKREDAIQVYGPFAVMADELKRDSTQFRTFGDVLDRMGRLLDALKLDMNGFSSWAAAIEVADSAYGIKREALISDKRADVIEYYSLIAAALKTAAEGK